jgi:DNA-binding response OmpR family regulator
VPVHLRIRREIARYWLLDTVSCCERPQTHRSTENAYESRTCLTRICSGAVVGLDLKSEPIQRAEKNDAIMTAAQDKETISFGPFDLVPSERLLKKGGLRVDLSARAFEILLTLLSRPTK